jgi:hypothetical protein
MAQGHSEEKDERRRYRPRLRSGCHSGAGGVRSHPPFRTWAFQPVQKTATTHVSSGFIWGIPDQNDLAQGPNIMWVGVP